MNDTEILNKLEAISSELRIARGDDRLKQILAVLLRIESLLIEERESRKQP